MHLREAFFLTPVLITLLSRFVESLGSTRITSNWKSFLQASTGRRLAYISDALATVNQLYYPVAVYVPDLYDYRYLKPRHIQNGQKMSISF